MRYRRGPRESRRCRSTSRSSRYSVVASSLSSSLAISGTESSGPSARLRRSKVAAASRSIDLGLAISSSSDPAKLARTPEWSRPSSSRRRCSSWSWSMMCWRSQLGRAARRAPTSRRASGSPPVRVEISRAADFSTETINFPATLDNRRTESSSAKAESRIARLPGKEARKRRLVMIVSEPLSPGSSGSTWSTEFASSSRISIRRPAILER
jgi:hypothetical protein